MADYRCYGCMKEKNYKDVCPHCGHVNNELNEAFFLKEGHVIKNRFIIGKVLNKNSNTITYLAYDNSLLEKVYVKEYFPGKITTRNNEFSPNVIYKNNKAEKYNQGLKDFKNQAVSLTKKAGLSNSESAYEVIEDNNTVYMVMEYKEQNKVFQPLKQLKNSKKKIKFKPSSLVLAAFIFLLILFVTLKAIPDKPVMPNVVGMDYHKAEQILDSKGISYETLNAFSVDDGANSILRQNIPKGTKITKNNSVKITRNYAIEVPNFTGKNIEDAERLLKKGGFNYQILTVKNADYKPDTITKQSPDPGNYKVNTDIKITLYKAEPVNMPKVKGMQFTDADELLNKTNISYKLEKIYDEKNPGYIIAKQTPKSGTPVLNDGNKENEVVLTVNTAVVLPDIKGKNMKQAVTLLKDSGFLKIQIREKNTYIGKPNTITYTEGNPGQIVSTDTTINLNNITNGKVSFKDYMLKESITKQLFNSKEDTDITVTASKALTLEEITYEGEQDKKINNLTGIQYFKNLKTLILPKNNISDISPLFYTQALTHINLNDNIIANLNGIQAATRLETLRLNNNNIQNISEIEYLKTLYHLEASNNQITDIAPVEKLYYLTEIDFSFNLISDISPIYDLKDLNSANFSNNCIEKLPEFNTSDSISYLNISGNYIKNLNSVKTLKNLTTLIASHNVIYDLSPLKNIDKLKYLVLDDNKISNISALGSLNNLEILSIVNNPVTDYSFLKNLPKLSKLEIDGDGDYDDFEYIK